jgi:hypothetical protein
MNLNTLVIVLKNLGEIAELKNSRTMAYFFVLPIQGLLSYVVEYL